MGVCVCGKEHMTWHRVTRDGCFQEAASQLTHERGERGVLVKNEERVFRAEGTGVCGSKSLTHTERRAESVVWRGGVIEEILEPDQV